jgi:hypothetical protein
MQREAARVGDWLNFYGAAGRVLGLTTMEVAAVSCAFDSDAPDLNENDAEAGWDVTRRELFALAYAEVSKARVSRPVMAE